MKYKVSILLALLASWLVWSGHFQVWEAGFHHYFLLVLGLLSCLFCVWLAIRMKIVDEEGAPVQLGLRPFIAYFPWLLKEIVVSNIAVTKIILSPSMKLQRMMVEVTAHQQTELGRVILANSITATPGTISVHMEEDKIQVHALSFEGAEEDLSGNMDRRVCRLEKTK
ncbi:MAG: Na+/H+ antiporter subunit E [Mariniblastus sp.]|nr:Na+/H+ antiporter subunit E [Mariniblastus sp.]